MKPKQFKIFTIPFCTKQKTFDDREFQEFVANHKVYDVEKHFFQQDEAYWSFVVTYEPKEAPVPQKPSKDDVLDKLSAKDRQLYELLRNWRNERARQEGYASYVLFHNSQLAQIALHRPNSLSKLTEIPGIGTNKSQKYGKDVLQIVNNFVTAKDNQ